MRELLDRLPPGLRVSKPVVISAVAVGISAVVVWQGVASLLSAVTSPSISAEEADPIALLQKDGGDLLETSRARFVGRSMYQLPPAPVRKPKVVEQPKPVAPPPDPGPPPPPATYAGPAPTSVFGDYVMFSTLSDADKRIKLGETKSGIKVLEINAPYSVKLGYQRGEYTVTLWPRINESFLRGGMPAGTMSGIVEGSAAATPGLGTSGGTAGGISAPGAGSPQGAANANAATSGAGTGRGATGAGSGAPSATGGATNPAGAPANSPTAIPPARPQGTGPGDEPGADQPSGPGPEGELPSSAMAPQRLPSPTNGEPEGDDGQQGIEYVDRALLPPRLEDAQISAMTLEQAQNALAAIDATRSWSVDDQNRARLNHERGQLVARVNRGN
ncbi:MAG: hypothetical protein RIR10_1951 [Planctomycetota bacterium]|jgi:hypothetical protein